jgi:hypothetical protein
VIPSPQKFNVTQSIAAGATLDVLQGYIYETPDQDCMVEIIEAATAVGLVGVHTSAGETIQQEAPVQAGATAGVFGARLNTEPITGRAPKYQKLRSFYRNPTGGAITLNYSILLTPLSNAGVARRGAPPRRSRRRKRSVRPGMARIARPSSTQALRQVGVIGNPPIDLDPTVQASLELRPQRYEEHHDYNIVRWQSRIFVGAVAARFTGVWFGNGGLGPSQEDALHVVESVRNTSASIVFLSLGTLPALANVIVGGVYAKDSRWAPNLGGVQVFNGMWQSGDIAALTGNVFDQLAAGPATGAYDETQIGLVLQQRVSGDALLCWANTVNVALSVMIKGYTVLPR